MPPVACTSTPHLHAHAATATPNLRHVAWVHDHVRIEALCFDGVLDPSGGCIVPDASGPGHALTLRRTDVDTQLQGGRHGVS